MAYRSFDEFEEELKRRQAEDDAAASTEKVDYNVADEEYEVDLPDIRPPLGFDSIGEYVYVKNRARERGEDFPSTLYQTAPSPDAPVRDLGRALSDYEQPWRPLAAGDPDDILSQYMAADQTDSAHAEQEMHDAAQKARRALERDPNGQIYTAEERATLARIAGTGQPDEIGGFWGGLLALFDRIDRPGELIRAAITDMTGLDERRGAEITLQDYWDVLIGNDDLVRERLGAEVVGSEEGNFLFEGRMYMEEAGLTEENNEAVNFLGGLLFDIGTDPLTYLTWGLAGLGKKAAVEASTAAAAGAWKEATRALRHGTVDTLTDGIEKRAARLIQKRIDDEAGELVESMTKAQRQIHPHAPDTYTRSQGRLAAKNKIIREEERMADFIAGTRIKEFDEADDVVEFVTKMGDSGPVKGTALHDEVAHLAKLQAEGRLKDLAELFPEYMASKNMPDFAKGGLRLAPFPGFRKNMPMLYIPGTRTNSPIRSFANDLLDKLPKNTRQWLTDMGERISSTRQMLNRARDFEPHKNKLSTYVAGKVAFNALNKTKLGASLHGVPVKLSAALNGLGKLGDSLGKSRDEMHKLVRQVMGRNPAGLADLPASAQKQIWEVALGVRHALETVFAAGEQVGMRLNHMDDYVPLVSNPHFRKITDAISDAGHAVPIEQAADSEERLGLEILAAFSASEGERTPSLVRRLGESPHARTRIETATVASAGIGEDIRHLDLEELKRIVDDAELAYYDHDTLNRAVTKALNRMADDGLVDSRQVAKLDEAPFWTDLAEIMDAYTTSMAEAIQLHDAARRFRQMGLLANRTDRISITRTLAETDRAIRDHPVWRLLDDIAASTEEGAAMRVRNRLSEPVQVNVGKGWDIEVPAGAAAHPHFERTVNRLRNELDKTLRNAAQSKRAVDGAVHELVAKGVPEEIAVRIHLLDSNAAFRELQDEMRRMAVETAEETRVLALEQIARNGHRRLPEKVMTEQYEKAVHATAEMRAGVEETIEEMDRQIAERLGFNLGLESDEVFDLASREYRDGRTMQQWIADTADSKIRAEPAALGPDERYLDFVDRAVTSLADTARVSDLTVGDVVRFSGDSQRRAAIALSSLYDKVLEASGDRALAEQIMPTDLRNAVDVLSDAEDHLRAVRSGAVDDTLESAQVQVAEAAARVASQTDELVDNDVLVADVVEQVHSTVRVIEDDPLFSPAFMEVEAAAFHKLDLMDRGEWAQYKQANEAFAREMLGDDFARIYPEGYPKSASQTELFEQNTKRANRFAAAKELQAYRDGADELARAAPDVPHEGTSLGEAIRLLRQAPHDPAARQALPRYEREVRILAKLADDKIPADRIFVSPSGSVVFAPDQSRWVTIDDVLPELQQIVPNGDELAIHEVVGTAVEAWRRDPDALESLSDDVAAWLRHLDENGGLDYAMETYEYLKDFSARLRTTGADLGRRAGDEVVQEIAEFPERFVYQVTPPQRIGNIQRQGVRNGGYFASVDEAADFIADRPALDEATAKVVAVRRSDLHEFQRKALERYGIITDAFRGGEVPPNKVAHVWDWADGRPRPPMTPAETKAVNALDEVLDAVDKAARGSGVGEKTLRNVWEKNAHVMKGVLPVETVDLARTLVDYTVGLRHLKLPKTILNKQFAMRTSMWNSLDDAYRRLDDDIIGLADEAVEKGSDSLLESAAAIRHFQERMAELHSYGDTIRPSRQPRVGKEALVPDDHPFKEAFSNAKRSLRKALDEVKKIPKEERIYLEEMVLPGERSLDEWIEAAQKQMDEWKPVKVSTRELEGYVDLSQRGVAGEVFGDTLAERHVAIMLDHMAARVASLTTEKGLRNLVENTNKAVRWWRASATVGRPTFVPRNVLGGIFNGTIGAVGPTHYAFTARHIMPAVGRVRAAASTWDEVIEEAAPVARGYLRGIRDSDVLETSFAISSLDHLKRNVPITSRLNPASTQNGLFYLGARAMEKSEDFLRAASFVAHYNPKRPTSALTAKAITLALHFDYKNITPMERWLKKLVPFLTWTKNNIPLQLRTIMEQPGVYTRYHHFVRNVQGMQEDVFADDFADSQYRGALAMPLQFIIGENSPQWSRLVLDPDLPFRDVEELLKAASEGVPGMTDWAIGLLSPQYSAPIDFLSNQDYEVPAPTGLAEIIKLTDPLIPGEPIISLDDRVMVEAGWANLFRTAIPFLQENLQVAGVTPSSGRQAARLGVDLSDGVDLGERVRQGALRLARAFGLTSQVPGDSDSAAWRAESQIFDIQEKARLEGRLVDPEHMDALLEAIINQHG